MEAAHKERSGWQPHARRGRSRTSHLVSSKVGASLAKAITLSRVNSASAFAFARASTSFCRVQVRRQGVRGHGAELLALVLFTCGSGCRIAFSSISAGSHKYSTPIAFSSSWRVYDCTSTSGQHADLVSAPVFNREKGNISHPRPAAPLSRESLERQEGLST